MEPQQKTLVECALTRSTACIQSGKIVDAAPANKYRVSIYFRS
jgi:hypothetical protein